MYIYINISGKEIIRFYRHKCAEIKFRWSIILIVRVRQEQVFDNEKNTNKSTSKNVNASNIRRIPEHHTIGIPRRECDSIARRQFTSSRLFQGWNVVPPVYVGWHVHAFESRKCVRRKYNAKAFGSCAAVPSSNHNSEENGFCEVWKS